MLNHLIGAGAAGLLLAAVGCAEVEYIRTADLEQPAGEAATEDRPGLRVGDRAPDAEVWTIEGKPVKLSSLYAEGPVVLTFYRGGWCPYCNRALTEWEGRTDELKAAGGRLIALTPEAPDRAVKTREKNKLGFSVYSDYALEAARRYKVAFEVDEKTQKAYKGFGVDLAEWNANHEWKLPAPGTFVIGTDGVIRYAFADWDYKKRADPEEVIGAVRKLK